MPNRPDFLPDFKTPPVVEVAIAAQFSTLPGYRTVHSGLMWEVFRNRFPKFDEQPPLNPTFETFGAQPRKWDTPRLEVLGSFPSPRLWFLNKDETQLIQFQPDRFAHNWRKVEVSHKYPRYESIKKEFLSGLRKVKKFAKDEQLGEFVPNQVEITYVNQIVSKKGENLPASLGSVFNCWSNKRLDKALGIMEISRFHATFILYVSDNDPIGRLYVTAEPLINSDGSSMIQLPMLARVHLAKPTLKAVEEFMDFVRERIVRMFADITTTKMHERCGRKS